jgi:hypothetical protein
MEQEDIQLIEKAVKLNIPQIVMMLPRAIREELTATQRKIDEKQKELDRMKFEQNKIFGKCQILD